MPSAGFFRALGLFIRDDFLNPSDCADLQGRVSLAETEKSLIVRHNGEGDVLDENVRKVLSVRAEVSIRDNVWTSILNLRPVLEDHFRLALGPVEEPVFLRYGIGAFYRPHKDGHPASPESTRPRQVSVVIFLNSHTQEPCANSFQGGALTFYGLMNGPQWEKCAFDFNGTQGQLVAFRSDTLHEVRPVTFGERFTIVTWFRSPHIA